MAYIHVSHQDVIFAVSTYMHILQALEENRQGILVLIQFLKMDISCNHFNCNSHNILTKYRDTQYLRAHYMFRKFSHTNDLPVEHQMLCI